MKTSSIALKGPAIRSLAALAAMCGVLISTVHAVTKSTITTNQQEYALRQLKEVAGDPTEVASRLTDELYYTSKNGKLTGYVFQQVTHEGYNGTIKYWIAVDTHQVIRGVRVFEHQETPGIGDRIDIRVSSWIKRFNEKTLVESTWSLTKDGGSFDHFTGATITSRAMVKSVGAGLVLAKDEAAEWAGRVGNDQR